MKSRILIKIGGRAFEGEQGFKELAIAINASPELELMIVHGGGAEISQALKDAKRETKFIDGIRVTRAEDIRIVEDVLSGTVNLRIASWLSDNGVECRRMSGKTENLFLVEPLARGGLNWGYVGKIKRVNADAVLKTILRENCRSYPPYPPMKKAQAITSMPTVPQRRWPPLSGALTLSLSLTFPECWSTIKSGRPFPFKKRRP